MPHKLDKETWPERVTRLDKTAGALDSAIQRATCEGQGEECKRSWRGNPKVLAKLMITTMIHESALAQHVHENRCYLKLGECDSDRYYSKAQGKWIYYQKAFSLWQIQKGDDISSEDWAIIKRGVDGTEVAAWHATRRMASAYRACGTLGGAISRYARGNGCHIWEGSKERMVYYYALDKYSKRRLEKRTAAAKTRSEKQNPNVD